MQGPQPLAWGQAPFRLGPSSMKVFHPLPQDLMESRRYTGDGTQIFEFKGLTGKIRKTKELAPISWPRPNEINEIRGAEKPKS